MLPVYDAQQFVLCAIYCFTAVRLMLEDIRLVELAYFVGMVFTVTTVVR